MFWFSKNLTELTFHPAPPMPWDFSFAAPISDQVRKDKRARQDWYQSKATDHYFYTTIEAANPNMRPSKENPPRAIHAFAVDYDLKISPERIQEAIAEMPFKPAYVERSLGGNARLVWLLPRPIPVDTYDFCAFILERSIDWLALGLLPGLDEAAFKSPTRLLCNGCDWQATGQGPISATALQAFFVACGKEFRFKGPAEGIQMPLDVVETELKKRYPSFNWPVDFLPDSQGPTFWIPESTSPASAILKPEGIITFAAHASKPFYSWSDLLGAEFVKAYAVEAIAKATQDIYWDSKRFWKKKEGIYTALDAPELNNFFRVQCKLSVKPGAGGSSAIDTALDHIYNAGAVSGAGPFVFRPPGVINFMGRKVLNTYRNRAIQPAEGEADRDNFLFLAALLESMFDPTDQVNHFLAWWKHAYAAAVNEVPMPGQNIFLMGGAGVGKTLLNREIVGRSLGGHIDASNFLIRGESFNNQLFEVPLWCIDDETASESESTRQNFSAMLKKCTANSTHNHKKKFEVESMVEWLGRIFCTTNLDYVSSRLLGSMDNTSMDKTSLFRCSKEATFQFPSRLEVQAAILRELPYFLRWLLDWTPPEEVIPDMRFGYKSYHDPGLLEKSHQGSRSAPFKELLVESLMDYFENHPEKTEWRGSVTQVIRLLHVNPMNEYVIRTMRIEQASRYLEAIQREGLIKCTVESGDDKQRLWCFARKEKTK